MQNQMTPLLIAASNGHLAIVELLIKRSRASASSSSALSLQLPNSQQSSEFLGTGDSNGRTALHIATEQNMEAIVVALLAAGANREQPDANGVTPRQLIRSQGVRDAFDPPAPILSSRMLLKSGRTSRPEEPTPKSTPKSSSQPEIAAAAD